MPVYLMRHAETDWAQVNARQWQGPLNDFAPLTEAGVAHARRAAEGLQGLDIELVVSSPMTRALETAAIVSASLDVPLQIALDLREWLPDESLSWTSSQEVLDAYDDMIRHGGVRPGGHRLAWEPLDAVRERAERALASVAGQGAVLAVCHAVVIYALTGQEATDHCVIVPKAK